MEDEKYTSHVESGAANGGPSAPPQKVSFWTKRKNHYKRFWWLHLLILIIVVLVVTLPLVYVGFPNIAQSQLNKSTLNITMQQITNPTPTSVQLAQMAIAGNPSSYHPNLDGFQAALFLEDTEPNIQPFGYIEIPPLHATRYTGITTNQTLNITNMDQFTAYNNLGLTTKTYRVALRGRTKLHEMKFPTTTVDFNQVVTLNGLNNFDGINVTNFQLFLTPQGPDQANLIGEILIPNPTIQAIEFGNVTFNVSVDGQNIGQSFLNNLMLMPGNHTYPLRSTTDQEAVIGLITSKYKDGILPLTLIGESVVYNGQHLPYFEGPLRNSTQHLNLNVGPALAQLGLNLGSLSGSNSTG
ncbi:hypothetical protein EV356DRAFT_442974 [Viridothelium virens]|uniref:Uncharacterized protein n=1 Tax=Viridothelium virens TaxID=1048519 RepID=A0A6A6HFI7_VIRVR|nr:hypothetical protein EV356DRAFT_442974 [Viridothelium virens]